MTEQVQENFGLAAEQERAGYEPLRPAFPIDAPSEAPEFDSTREAANEVAEKREQAQRDSSPPGPNRGVH